MQRQPPGPSRGRPRGSAAGRQAWRRPRSRPAGATWTSSSPAARGPPAPVPGQGRGRQVPPPGTRPRRLCSAPGRKRQLTAAEEPRSQVVGRGSGRCSTPQRRAEIRLWSASWPPMGPRTRSTTPMTRWVRLTSPCSGTTFEHGRALCDSPVCLYFTGPQ